MQSCCTLLHSAAALGESCWVYLQSLGWVHAHWEFSLKDDRVGEWDLTVVCAYVSNNSSEYTAFLGSLSGVWKNTPLCDFIVLLGDNDSVTLGWCDWEKQSVWPRKVFCHWTSALTTADPYWTPSSNTWESISGPGTGTSLAEGQWSTL